MRRGASGLPGMAQPVQADAMTDVLASMTGFGRSAGGGAGQIWAWELRTVNARGLDVRLKLPPGWEAAEAGFRQRIGDALHRGSVQAQLSWTQDAAPAVAVNTALLDRLLALASELAARIPAAPPPRAEALLALPGVLRAGGEPIPRVDAEAITVVGAGLAGALAELAASRHAEGARLGAMLVGQVDEIDRLTQAAREEAAGQPLAQRQRLMDTLRSLLEAQTRLDESRFAQEVALLASRADVREELDRLDSHVAQARALVAEGGAVGRRLDFLTQEFMREANTLCSKSATIALTALGLRLKAVIEQLREQVQNLE